MQSPIASAGAHRRNVNWATHDFNDVHSWPIVDTQFAMPNAFYWDIVSTPGNTQPKYWTELSWTLVQVDFVSTWTKNQPCGAPVHQISDDAMTEQKFRRVRGIFFSIALSLPFFPVLALTRDLDGKYANSPFKQWFDSLASRRGPCCSVADGQSVEDVDWDTKNGQYRVRLDGQWIEVPAEALVTVPNKFGLAVVWPYKDYEGRTQIRCFIPGAGG
jgi:hypothetical protein